MHSTIFHHCWPMSSLSLSSNRQLLKNSPQFIYWARHSVVCNVPLASSCQPSGPGSFPASGASPHWHRVSLQRPWFQVRATEQQLEYQCGISAIVILNPNHNSFWKKMNSYPSWNHDITHKFSASSQLVPGDAGECGMGVAVLQTLQQVSFLLYSVLWEWTALVWAPLHVSQVLPGVCSALGSCRWISFPPWAAGRAASPWVAPGAAGEPQLWHQEQLLLLLHCSGSLQGCFCHLFSVLFWSATQHVSPFLN